ncbi:MAG: hypothetical protein IJ774_14705 [Selenomonadaceae bacterium]|nr:hypothetical protein [Selenomonadaceae bacterium]
MTEKILTPQRRFNGNCGLIVRLRITPIEYNSHFKRDETICRTITLSKLDAMSRCFRRIQSGHEVAHD